MNTKSVIKYAIHGDSLAFSSILSLFQFSHDTKTKLYDTTTKELNLRYILSDVFGSFHGFEKSLNLLLTGKESKYAKCEDITFFNGKKAITEIELSILFAIVDTLNDSQISTLLCTDLQSPLKIYRRDTHNFTLLRDFKIQFSMDSIAKTSKNVLVATGEIHENEGKETQKVSFFFSDFMRGNYGDRQLTNDAIECFNLGLSFFKWLQLAINELKVNNFDYFNNLKQELKEFNKKEQIKIFSHKTEKLDEKWNIQKVSKNA